MQTALIIIGTIIAAFVVLVFIAKRRLKNIPTVEDHKDIITLNESNFQAKTKNKVVLIDFWAAWCGPCRMMAPILNSTVKDLKGNQHIGKVNIEQHQALAQKFKVRSIPTMIILKNGVEVARFSGVKSKDFLLNQFRRFE